MQKLLVRLRLTSCQLSIALEMKIPELIRHLSRGEAKPESRTISGVDIPVTAAEMKQHQ